MKTFAQSVSSLRKNSLTENRKGFNNKGTAAYLTKKVVHIHPRHEDRVALYMFHFMTLKRILTFSTGF